MEKVQMQRFKQIFESERDRLVCTHGEISDQFSIQRDDLFDECDQTSVDLEQSMRLRLKSREALYLKKIEDALKRIKEGQFGNCEVCEEDIELRRLQARPTTTLCLNCKEEQEQKEKFHVEPLKYARAIVRTA